MKKFLAMILVAAMLLSLLSGCGQGVKAPETMETTMEIPTETMAAETTTGSTETTEAPTEATVEATTEPTEVTVPVTNDTVFRAGTWMAQCGPTSRYYFFEMGGEAGRLVNMKDGADVNFSYVQTGDQGILSLGANGAGAACRVVVQDEDHITLEWENQTVETMTYVSSLGADQFHFYTHEELAQMALEDYRAKHDPGDESLQAAAMDNGDGISTIQIYQNLGDHNSTAAYYSVDRCTGEGQNISNGTEVDLTRGTQDMDIFYWDSELEMPEDTRHFVLNETEYTELVVLQPLVNVTDFQVVSLELVEAEGDFGFRVKELLYDAVSMGPESALVLYMELPEIVPNVGVLYTDRYGEEQFYAVMYSGLDGSVLLVEQTQYE